ncbi:MAG: TIGR03936 family radical SAM-associated protein [Propionibacteriaceae bacterium]|nr:TIGR03936 family radical SAM-associated protein [Propionibacteriaceae bacterium]
MARKQPPQQPPPVQKLLVQYGKQGRGRFASHRDYARTFERALIRARVPMAYSSGFHPHPRISYINPAATGTESFAEYLVIALAELCDPGELMSRLSAAMPEGFPIVEVREVDPTQVWEASLWEITLCDPPATGRLSHPPPVSLSDCPPPVSLSDCPPTVSLPDSPPPVSLREVAGPIEWFLSQSEILVSREVKSGIRTFDARSAVEALVAVDAGTASTVPTDPVPRIRLVLRHTEPLVRPSDVVGVLFPDLTTPARYCRLAQGTVADLLAVE